MTFIKVVHSELQSMSAGAKATGSEIDNERLVQQSRMGALQADYYGPDAQEAYAVQQVANKRTLASSENATQRGTAIDSCDMQYQSCSEAVRRTFGQSMA